MKEIRTAILIIFISMPGVLMAGHKSDSTDSVPVLKPIHRNTIKFNPTPMLIWGEMRNITFSYERVINPKQSFSIQAGYLVYPKLFEDTLVDLISLTRRHKYGLNLSADYRFYPFKRNKRPVPDGLYIGPYVSYYGNFFENDFDILNTTIDQNGNYKCNINIVNVGFELGYQFIFWKRLSLDLLLFGPSVSFYSANLKVSGSLDEDEIQNISDEVAQKLLDRFPMIGYLFTNGELSKTGFRSKFGAGFRYSIQIGFHF
jgi:hypothetical protein